MTISFDKYTKNQAIPPIIIISLMVFVLTTFIIPAINTNADNIDINSEDIQNINLKFAELDGINKKLDTIVNKIIKIELSMCGEFGGKHCE